MGLLNFLFNSSKQQSEDKARDEKEKQFDVLKYDGVRALHSGQVNYAVDCFRHALAIKDDMETMDYFSLDYLENMLKIILRSSFVNCSSMLWHIEV